MKRILFRADANPAIGTGDLTSLVYLADTFRKDGWEPHFLVRRYEASLALCRKYGLENVAELDAQASLDQEQALLRSLVEDRGLDALFFEITERPLSHFQELVDDLRGKVFKGCVCFDGALPRGMDLVLDWDVAAQGFFNPGEHPGTTFLLGPQYVFLPPEFDMDRVARRSYRPRVERVLVSMGGADELDFTRKAAEVLARLGVDAEFRFVLGAAYGGRDGLEHFLEGSGVRYSLAVDVRDMFLEYMACDFAVGAGGLTASELVASGTPCALVALYEHQEARCVRFGQMGLATYLGFRDLHGERLFRALTEAHPPAEAIPFVGKTTVLNHLNRAVRTTGGLHGK